MSEPAVQLPDPLSDSAGAADGSADDLLAQLAGQEVERLLAEHDSGAAALSPANVDRSAPASEAAPRLPSTTQGPSGSPLPAIEHPDEAEKAAEDPTGAALDDFFRDIGGSQAPAVNPQHQAIAGTLDGSPIQSSVELSQDLVAQAQLEAMAEIEGQRSAAAALAAELEQDERDTAAALARGSAHDRLTETIAAPADPGAGSPSSPSAVSFEPVMIDEESLAQHEDRVDGDFDDAPPRLSLLIRLLEWMNSPLAGCSEAMRSAIGKVAIVTLINALGLLVYVLAFRKH